ncbi:hypothetical protein [Cupriavidus sp. H18C2]|uniref:hypothetical protein n=1 Tax=Cupriavidus sp. H18C2 TaxID=3241602 RepID=UPI003BF7CAE5
MSTYYTTANVSTCDIAGAVAAAAIHDLTVNNFTFPGFPQILITESDDETFNVELSFERRGQRALVMLTLKRKEAFATAKHFTKNMGSKHDPNIFERVQTALAELEGRISRMDGAAFDERADQ